MNILYSIASHHIASHRFASSIINNTKQKSIIKHIIGRSTSTSTSHSTQYPNIVQFIHYIYSNSDSNSNSNSNMIVF
jgi:hypothetical protein